MRLQIDAVSPHPVNIPFNYQNQLRIALSVLLKRAFQEYAECEASISARMLRYLIASCRLFTFSRLSFVPVNRTAAGFANVRRIRFLFVAPAHSDCEALLTCVFGQRIIFLTFDNVSSGFGVVQVQRLPEPVFTANTHGICLSPITLVDRRYYSNRKEIFHYLDYTINEEREQFCRKLRDNLTHKFFLVNRYRPNFQEEFDFSFDPEYIKRREGRISKLIHLENGQKIKAFEAPFDLRADPALIRTAYECGLGDRTCDGFGCVEYLNAGGSACGDGQPIDLIP